MSAAHIITHSLLYAVVFNGYLLLMMVTTNPRVWGYSDYPDEIKAKIPPQTKEERRKAILWAIPMMVFAIGFPIYSTLLLKSNLGNDTSFWLLFLNALLMVFLAYLIDLVVLDWLIIEKITPDFVIIEGTEPEDYKDFSHHYRAQLLTAPFLLLIVAAISAVIYII